ncbi:MAG TPA: methyltransferase, partial [Ruminococcaceae bacterium]|nr:methyltransferase [Oscillospiraceae bacterium]
ATVCGVDISKIAVMSGAKRNQAISLAVAGVFDLPLKNETVDTVVNVFAPDACAEFARVLKPNGVYLRVLPMENHLIELKRAVYDVAQLNPPAADAPQGFSRVQSTVISYSFTLKNQQEISDLFCMTPYYYKTSRADQEKLKSLDKLTVTAQFAVQVLKKKKRVDL